MKCFCDYQEKQNVTHSTMYNTIGSPDDKYDLCKIYNDDKFNSKIVTNSISVVIIVIN